MASLSRQKVLTTAKPQPYSKDLLIMGYEVVGGAEAKPNGLMNGTPKILISN